MWHKVYHKCTKRTVCTCMHIYKLIDKREETTHSSREACFVVSHWSGDVLIHIGIYRTKFASRKWIIKPAMLMYCLSYAHFFPFFAFFFGLFCSSASVCTALFLSFFFSFTTRKLAFPTFSPSGFDPSSLSCRSFKITFLFSFFLSFWLNRVLWGHELLSKSG